MTINFDALVVYNLPVLLRRIKRFRWLRALLLPIVTLYAEWTLFYEIQVRKTYENSRTLVLEQILNDNFDNILRRIRIQNQSGTTYERFIYPDGEADPNTDYIYTDDETPAYDKIIFLRYDAVLASLIGKFNVLVPDTIFDNPNTTILTLITNKVASVKLATVDFSILRYVP